MPQEHMLWKFSLVDKFSSVHFGLVYVFVFSLVWDLGRVSQTKLTNTYLT